jgi:ATP-dependent protease ClpP protease subunit
MTVRGEFTDGMASKFISDLEAIQSDEVFVYISSPGGSGLSGYKMISYLRASPKKIVCIVDVAISMGFAFLQACDERISMLNSISMQHVASYGIAWQQAPNALSFQKFIERMILFLDKEQAKRIGISFDKFKTLTRSDWWLFGEDTSAAGVTDRTAHVTCSRRVLQESVSESVTTPFGPVLTNWSKCPLLTEPLSVDSSKANTKSEGFDEFIKSLNVRQTILEKLETAPQ